MGDVTAPFSSSGGGDRSGDSSCVISEKKEKRKEKPLTSNYPDIVIIRVINIQTG